MDDLKLCNWTFDWDEEAWNTQCKNAWVLVSGSPSENKMQFCPFCGALLNAPNDPFFDEEDYYQVDPDHR